MATQEQQDRALLTLMMVGPEAAARLINQCGSDAEVVAWLNRETRMGPEKAAVLAPVLREAVAGMTLLGADAAQRRARR